MAQYIDKDALIADIEIKRDRIKKGIISIPLTGSDRAYATFEYEILGKIKDFLDTLEVKEVDISSISENLAEAEEYLNYTHTSNLAHNKPMIAARLRKAIKELYSAGLFQLTHDEKYRLESLGLKAQKGK